MSESKHWKDARVIGQRQSSGESSTIQPGKIELVPFCSGKIEQFNKFKDQWLSYEFKLLKF